MAARMAHAMVDLGLSTGDRVAVQVEKSPEALALYAACLQAGLIFLPLNTAYTIDELSYFIENSGSSLVVCDDARVDRLQAVAQGLGARVESLNADGSGSFADPLQGGHADP